MKVKLTGKVERVDSGRISVTYDVRTNTGDTFKRWAKVWTHEPAKVGDVVEITGDGDVRLETYEKDGITKQSAWLHINHATIKNDAPF